MKMKLYIDEPKYCGDCPISAYGEYCCQVLDECPGDEDEMENTDKRPSWCPLKPEDDWIPVTERMPEEHRTKNSELEIKNGYPETISDSVIVTFQDDWDGELYVDVDNTINGGFDGPVTAWMPLPEPWKGDAK